MSYFIFNGVRSDDMGLILPSTPFRPSWAEEHDEIMIPGRPEAIYQPTGHYESQTLTIRATMTDMTKARYIYQTLHGSGTLILSTDTAEYMNVKVEVLTPKGVALDMAEIDIQFTCSPFAYSVTPTEVDVTQSYSIINNTSTIYSAPRFEIQLAETEETILKGDVNFDGRVDSTDAALVLAEYARIQGGDEPTFTDAQREAADMNNDGLIDSSDAMLVLKKYAETQGQQEAGGTSAAEDIQIDVNGEVLNIGIPAEALIIGAKVVVDCGLYLIYYEDTEGQMINIMQHSSMDLPMLTAGENAVKYTGENVESMKCIINERWL